MKRLAPLLLLAVGCSVVKMHRVMPGYGATERTRTKRLLCLARAGPEGTEKVSELFALVARRYVNQKRNFLVKAHGTASAPLELRAHCQEGVEGVLWLEPELERKEGGVQARLEARLLRCEGGAEIWAADAAGSFPAEDPGLKEVTAQYVAELGAEVGPYVPSALYLLRPALDTLPDPLLSEEEVEEKIELGD
ncbi:MAG: MXAN_6521/LA_1396 family lipoprotein [Myxococcales bacterium]|nr:MXAN_6521/LA_1396 family lipoprotein [Myxococcales bacterium]